MDEHRDVLLAQITASLAPRFDGQLAHETVERYVRESYDLLERTAQVQRNLPERAERFTRERLVALTQAFGIVTRPVPQVLFVCTRNAGRSQIAAALTARYAAGRVHVRTAGTDPARQVNPTVGLVLAEIGLDVGMEFPKPLTDEIVAAADVVVTMGCGDACPVYPGRRYQDWLLDEPEGAPLDKVRAIRDHIDERVRELLAELINDPPADAQ